MLTPSDLETCACEAMYFPFASALFSSFVGSILFNGSLQYNFSVHHLFDQGFFFIVLKMSIDMKPVRGGGMVSIVFSRLSISMDNLQVLFEMIYEFCKKKKKKIPKKPLIFIDLLYNFT